MTHRRALVVAVLYAVAAWPLAGGAAVPTDNPDVVVFYREGCHDCERMDGVLGELQQSFPRLTVIHLEEASNAGLLWSLSATYGILPSAFPVIFVGVDAIVGAGRDKELRLRNAVAACMQQGCPSPLAPTQGAQIPWSIILIAGLVLAALFLLLAL